MRRALGGAGLLLLFIAIFLPWLGGDSLISGVFQQLTLKDSVLILSLILMAGATLGALFSLLGRIRWSLLYPGILSILSGGFWLYGLSEVGEVPAMPTSLSTLLYGPFIVIAGGVILLSSGRGSYRPSGGYRGRPPMSELKHAPSGRRDRVRFRAGGVATLVILWFIATGALSGLTISETSYLWYSPYLLGIASGVLVGYRYFKRTERVGSRGSIFLATIASFVIAPIIGSIPFAILPVGTCSFFPSLFASCSGDVLTFLNFYAPADVAGLVNAVTCFTTPLAIAAFLSALYGAYRLAHSVEVIHR